MQYGDGFLFSFLNASYKLLNCKTQTAYDINYSDSFNDLVIVTFFTFKGESISTNIQYLLDKSEKLEKMSSLSGININHIFYFYPESGCKNNTMDLFLDVLLNQKLLEGKTFKLISILAHLNNDELIDLSNIASSFQYLCFDTRKSIPYTENSGTTQFLQQRYLHFICKCT